VRRVLGVALASLLSAAALFAQAQQPARIELDVVGELTIDTDGSVRDYAIGSPLPKEVVAAVGTAVKRWRFSPVVRDGRAVTAKTPMYLLLSATQEAAGYRMRVDRVQFGVGRELASARGFHHAYPRDAMRSRQGAQVLVALRIDGAGKVLEAVPLRSRLVPRVTNAKQSARQRAQFEDAVVGMMAQAKFQPADPAKGEPEQATFVLPISFTVNQNVRPLLWTQADAAVTVATPPAWLGNGLDNGALDRLRDGQSLVLDGAPVLQTPVVGTSL
jgi:TonB family protein